MKQYVIIYKDTSGVHYFITKAYSDKEKAQKDCDMYNSISTWEHAVKELKDPE